MNPLRRLLSDAVIYSVTPMLSALVGLILIPIYTRSLSPSEYGALAQVNTTTALATTFVVFGLDNSSAIWFWEHPEAHERSRTFSTWLAFTLSTSALVGFVAILARKWLAQMLLHDSGLHAVWLLFAANILMLNVVRIGVMWFRMERTPWPAVSLSGFTALATGVCGVYFVVGLRLGVAGVIASQAAGSWLGAIATGFRLRRVFSLRAVDLSRLTPMLRLSAPLVLMTNLNWVMGSSVTYFVNFLCSSRDAGLYQVASSLVGVLGLLMFAFSQAWSPFALAIRDAATAKRVYGITVEATLVLGLLFAFSAAVFAQPALLLIADPRYVAARWVFVVLAFNAVIIYVPSVLAVTFAREKVTMPLAKASALGTVVCVILLPILARHLGKEGAALAVLFSSVTVLLVAFRASQSVFPIHIDLRRVGAAIVIVCVWFALFMSLRGWAQDMLTMIAMGTVLLASIALALAALYRGPLRMAWAGARVRTEP